LPSVGFQFSADLILEVSKLKSVAIMR